MDRGWILESLGMRSMLLQDLSRDLLRMKFIGVGGQSRFDISYVTQYQSLEQPFAKNKGIKHTLYHGLKFQIIYYKRRIVYLYGPSGSLSCRLRDGSLKRGATKLGTLSPSDQNPLPPSNIYFWKKGLTQHICLENIFHLNISSFRVLQMC